MRNLAVRRLGALVVAMVALTSIAMLASRCGALGMSEHHQRRHGGGGGAPQTPVLSSASEVSVAIADYDFVPRDLTIRAGTAVTWTNRNGASHDATDRACAWGTGFPSRGENGSVTFKSPGAYEYECTIHPNMKGTLAVEAAR